MAAPRSPDTYAIPLTAGALIIALVPYFHFCYTNTYVQSALLNGWIPLVVAILLSRCAAARKRGCPWEPWLMLRGARHRPRPCCVPRSGSGMLLGALHDQYPSMAVLVPVMNSTRALRRPAAARSR